MRWVLLGVLLLPGICLAQDVVIEDVEDEDFVMLDEDDGDPEDWDDEDWGEEDWGNETDPAAGEEWDAVTDGEGGWDMDATGEDDAGESGQGNGGSAALGWLEEHLDIGGYYENQLAVHALPRHTSDPEGSGLDVLDYNKIRLDLAARPVPGFSADLDVVLRTYHGTTRYHLEDILPGKFAPDLAVLAAMDPSLAVYRLENDYYVDNAYLTASFWKLRLRVGKQQIRFGSGYMWNPTDPFNVIDPLDPSYEKVGITAARLQVFLPREGLLEVYVLPEPDLTDFHLEDLAVALRARVAVDRWVFATTYVYKQELAGIDLLDPDGSMQYSRRSLIGLEVTGELGGMGLWAELAINVMQRRNWSGLERVGRPDWIEALGGLSYTFRGGVMVMAEYLYNSRGGENSDTYTLWQWLTYLEQTIRTLGQHYASATLQVPVPSIHTTFAVTGIVNASDPSLLINPWIRFDWNQYLSVSLYGAITWGRTPASEFSSFGQGGYLRFRFSF